MNQDELIQFLKENLRIQIESVPYETEYCRPDAYAVKATIYLCDEEISSSESDTL
jgi:hypothetical protein